MFPQQPQQQFRTAGADVKLFYGAGSDAALRTYHSWLKPVGVSHVYMLLIGGGGGGDAANAGGGSGAVTVWYGAAQNVPNSLVIAPCSNSSGNASASYVYYRGSSSTLVQLLYANGGALAGAGGAAMTANQFTASGFFQSVAGQSGFSSAITASSTTFLSGGGYGSSGTANYGYKFTTNNQNGFFQLQPIIVGMGGSASTLDNVVAGIGCGGAYGASTGGAGGAGMVLIASW